MCVYVTKIKFLADVLYKGLSIIDNVNPSVQNTLLGERVNEKKKMITYILANSFKIIFMANYPIEKY